MCGGFTIWLWALIGDLDYYYKGLSLQNCNTNHPCIWCPCTGFKNQMPWYDFRVNAQWLDHIWQASAWFQAGFAKCPIFDERIGVSVLSVYPDWMHIKHLGIDKVLLGSVLHYLVHTLLPKALGDAAARLAFLWQEIMEEYDRQGIASDVRYGSLKLSMFTTKSQPKLKGKAIEVKYLGPVLHALWLKYMNTGVAFQRKVELVLRGSVHMDVLVDRCPNQYVLDEINAKDLLATGFAYLALWYELSQECKKGVPRLFGLTAKAHFLIHCCILARSSVFYSTSL